MAARFEVKFRLRGYDCLMALEDDTGSALLPKAEALVKTLAERGAEPLGQAAVATPAPAAAANGNGHTDDPAWCPIHEVAMIRHAKGGQAWYSHKDPGGSWCRGKANG